MNRALGIRPARAPAPSLYDGFRHASSPIQEQYNGECRTDCSAVSEPGMLEDMIGKKVVIDMSSPFVCIGKLTRFDEHFLELKNADLHDLRDTDTTRENYIAESRATGIKRNRKRMFLIRREMVAIALFDDVVFD
jgi:small nuclear ribonucleoprotein (snRNP)-like protein